MVFVLYKPKLEENPICYSRFPRIIWEPQANTVQEPWGGTSSFLFLMMVSPKKLTAQAHVACQYLDGSGGSVCIFQPDSWTRILTAALKAAHLVISLRHPHSLSSEVLPPTGAFHANGHHVPSALFSLRIIQKAIFGWAQNTKVISSPPLLLTLQRS